MSKAFHEVFPSIKYCAEVRSMQKILANASRVYCSGGPKIWPVTLLPHRNHSDINYQGIYRLLISQKDSGDPKHISKSALKDVLSLAQTRREQELICYTAVVSGHHSQTSAKKHLGLHNMNQCILDVEKCIDEAKLIYEAIEVLAQMEIDSLVAADNYTDDSLSEDEPELLSLKMNNVAWKCYSENVILIGLK